MRSESIKIKSANLFRRFFYQGFPVEQDAELLRKVITLNLIIFIGTAFTLILGVVAFIQSNYILGSVDLTISAFLVGLFYYIRTRKNYSVSARLGVVVMGLFFMYLFFSGGVQNTAFLWVLVYPPIVLFLLGNRYGPQLSLSFIIVVIVVFLFRTPLHIPASYSKDILIRFVAVYVSIHFISFAMERVRSLVQQQMEQANVELERTNKEKEKLIAELQHSIDEIKTLQGILPICARCKKIRNDHGYWEQVDEYIHKHSNVEFSHSICPECRVALYPELKNTKAKK